MSSDERPFPSRPSLSPASYALVTVIVFERWVLGTGALLPAVVPSTLLLAAACVLTSLAERRKGRFWLSSELSACILCSAIAALVVSSVCLSAGRLFERSMGSSSVLAWEFKALSDSSEGQYGFRCRARAQCPGAPPGEVWLSTPCPLVRGELVKGVGRYTPNANDEWGRASRMQGVWGSVSLVSVSDRGTAHGMTSLLCRVRDSAREAIDPERSDGRAVLAGCLLADKTALTSRGLDDLFACCGAAHLVAVSGSHLAVISALLARALECVHAKPPVRLALLAALTGGFILMCGLPASAVRAWLMSLLADGCVLLGRRGDALSSVSVVALAMALVEPALSGQMGFLLSVTCVLALTTFSSYAAYVIGLAVPDVAPPSFLSAELRISMRRARHELITSLGASMTCLVAALPLALSMRAQVALVGPLVTLPVSAAISTSMSLGLVGALISWIPLLGPALIQGASLVNEVALILMRVCAQLPLASVPVGLSPHEAGLLVLAFALALFVSWPRPTKRIVTSSLVAAMGMTLACVLSWTVLAPARVCVLDVGQGDAILVQDGWHAVLVDTGPDDSVVRALCRKHVLRLDAVVLTHLHDDHYGGVASLAGGIPCGRVIVAEGVAGEVPPTLAHDVMRLSGRPCEEVSYKDIVRVGRFELEVEWPRMPVDGDENPDSIIAVVRYENHGRSLSVLLTGDAEEEELESVIQAGDVGDIDVLKVGHHGSEVSIRVEQARMIHVDLAVASAGKDNEYGHPRQECITALEEAGARFVCTAEVGDVEVRPTARGFRCLTQRGALP